MGTPLRGRRTFKAAAIVLIAFGCLHLVAVFNGIFREPATEQLVELHRAAREARSAMGPFEFSAWGTIQILNGSYSILLLQAGVLSLLAMGPAFAAGRGRALTTANIVFVGLLLAITVAYRFPPPMVLAAAVLALLVVSLIRQMTPGAAPPEP